MIYILCLYYLNIPNLSYSWLSIHKTSSLGYFLLEPKSSYKPPSYSKSFDTKGKSTSLTQSVKMPEVEEPCIAIGLNESNKTHHVKEGSFCLVLYGRFQIMEMEFGTKKDMMEVLYRIKKFTVQTPVVTTM
jgi:hypothetical protein